MPKSGIYRVESCKRLARLMSKVWGIQHYMLVLFLIEACLASQRISCCHTYFPCSPAPAKVPLASALPCVLLLG